MNKPITIILTVVAVVAVGLIALTWSFVMGDNAATQDRIDSIGGESEKLQQEGQ